METAKTRSPQKAPKKKVIRSICNKCSRREIQREPHPTPPPPQPPRESRDRKQLARSNRPQSAGELRPYPNRSVPRRRERRRSAASGTHASTSGGGAGLLRSGSDRRGGPTGDTPGGEGGFEAARARARATRRKFEFGASVCFVSFV